MIAIISGASSGIGFEFAKQIDDKNYEEIWLIARRAEKLNHLKKILKTRAKILALDLCEEKSFEIIEDELKKTDKKIGLLINSAGVGINDYYKKTSLEDDLRTIDLNIRALISLSKISLKYFKKNGIILNISSSASFIPQPKFAIYGASKAFVLYYSRAIRREFKDIKVSVLCPNRVMTEFIKDDDKKTIKDLGNEDIKKLVRKALKQMGKKDIISSHPLSKLLLLISKVIPHSLIMKFEKMLGMY
ncbi:SDR family NAD(P)-dependent oxidoreductase [Anaerococcus sp. WCA-380-WT-2B]|uniref:NADP-dependent 3-hydroxy acid dehydrogenase YdfG n=1 Tax=Anaerococcus porci TaxID=2652269 RepID=A0A6N7VGW4_9FIRM|nr:SDR family NAD(P)-dependent oxidoreductase [Anaerococcus porci]MSS78685.1 SDR family NAD(P)-dependent oxidoreductase [Anaerococcus porci]